MNNEHCNRPKGFSTRFYENQTIRTILGGVFHPGGFKLTKELAQLAGVQEGFLVLDVASGIGSSAMFLAKEFGCQVIGVELSSNMAKEANAFSKKKSNKVFHLNGDAEKLPFKEGNFDVAISECSLCLFPCGEVALSEIFKVIKNGGKVAISDMTRGENLDLENENLSFLTCIAGAESLEGLKKKLEKVGFEDIIKLDRSSILKEFYEDLKPRIAIAKPFIRTLLNECGCSDLNQLAKFAKTLEKAILSGELGYGILIGKKPI